MQIYMRIQVHMQIKLHNIYTAAGEDVDTV